MPGRRCVLVTARIDERPAERGHERPAAADRALPPATFTSRSADHALGLGPSLARLWRADATGQGFGGDRHRLVTRRASDAYTRVRLTGESTACQTRRPRRPPRHRRQAAGARGRLRDHARPTDEPASCTRFSSRSTRPRWRSRHGDAAGSRSPVPRRGRRPDDGGGGNRTRVRGRTDRASTSLGCPSDSPAGRWTADQPPG